MSDAELATNLTLPPSLPTGIFGGHLPQFWRDRTGFLTRSAALGDVTYLKTGKQPLYFLNHPDMIRDLLVVNADKFVKGRALQRARSLLGDGLLTSEGGEHLRQRRMIQPAFHRARIAEYARIMVDFAEVTSATWADGDVKDIDHEMMNLTLHIVGKTLFDADVGSDADRVGKAMTTIVELFNFLVLPFSELLEKLPLPHTIRLKRARQTLDDVVYGIINERRRTAEDRGDLLSMLLAAQDEEDGSAMTDVQVRDEALTLFLAGHETTANAMTWTWYLLSQNPEAEARLHAELDRVLGERPPSMYDLPALKYSEAVIAESMRLYPPAWAVGRRAIADHKFGDYNIRAGEVALVSQWVMHRDERFWEAPSEFRPERWESMPVKDAGQRNIYFPFGGGVRRCIGESFAWTEGILLLATLARKWRLTLVPGQRIGVKPLITLRPKYGMKMSLSQRNL